MRAEGSRPAHDRVRQSCCRRRGRGVQALKVSRATPTAGRGSRRRCARLQCRLRSGDCCRKDADGAWRACSRRGNVVTASTGRRGLSASVRRPGIRRLLRSRRCSCRSTCPTSRHPRACASWRGRAALLRRARYRGEPGHPAFIGRDHWRAVSASPAIGAPVPICESGADDVECADLWHGHDVDRPVRRLNRAETDPRRPAKPASSP